jgi:hypothetical protein
LGIFDLTISGKPEIGPLRGLRGGPVMTVEKSPAMTRRARARALTNAPVTPIHTLLYSAAFGPLC